MPIKITINNKDVKNPIARLLISVLGLVIALLVFALLFFLLLPLIWFSVLTLALVMLTLFLAMPKLVNRYRIIVINRKNLSAR